MKNYYDGDIARSPRIARLIEDLYDHLPVLGVQPDSGGMAGNRLLFAGERLPQLPAAGHGLPDVRPLPICGAGYFYGGARHCSAGTASKRRAAIGVLPGQCAGAGCGAQHYGQLFFGQ